MDNFAYFPCSCIIQCGNYGKQKWLTVLSLISVRRSERYRQVGICARLVVDSCTLTYKILTTSQPTYLHNLICLQIENNTRSSDVVTLARPSPASSLKITDRSFQYASPHLWNQLPFLLREPVSPLYAYLNPSFSSPLSPFITPSLFHSKLKIYLFGKSFPP